MDLARRRSPDTVLEIDGMFAAFRRAIIVSDSPTTYRSWFKFTGGSLRLP